MSVLDWHRRKTHEGKIAFATPAEAWAAIEGLRQAGKAGEHELEIYRCWWGKPDHYHFGHPRPVPPRRLQREAGRSASTTE